MEERERLKIQSFGEVVKGLYIEALNFLRLGRKKRERG